MQNPCSEECVLKRVGRFVTLDVVPSLENGAQPASTFSRAENNGGGCGVVRSLGRIDVSDNAAVKMRSSALDGRAYISLRTNILGQLDD